MIIALHTAKVPILYEFCIIPSTHPMPSPLERWASNIQLGIHGAKHTRSNDMSIFVECIASDFIVVRSGHGAVQTDATSALFCNGQRYKRVSWSMFQHFVCHPLHPHDVKNRIPVQPPCVANVSPSNEHNFTVSLLFCFLQFYYITNSNGVHRTSSPVNT